MWEAEVKRIGCDPSLGLWEEGGIRRSSHPAVFEGFFCNIMGLQGLWSGWSLVNEWSLTELYGWIARIILCSVLSGTKSRWVSMVHGRTLELWVLKDPGQGILAVVAAVDGRFIRALRGRCSLLRCSFFQFWQATSQLLSELKKRPKDASSSSMQILAATSDSLNFFLTLRNSVLTFRVTLRAYPIDVICIWLSMSLSENCHC